MSASITHPWLRAVSYPLALLALLVLLWPSLVPSALLTALPALAVVVLWFTSMLSSQDNAGRLQGLGVTGFGLAYCVGLIPCLALLRDAEAGLTLAALALFCTWGADTCAYAVGRSIGRHKLCPSISPGKTIEGAIGGAVGAVAVAFVVRSVLGGTMATTHLIVIGALVAVVSVVGDLSASLLKRSVGAKDSSKLIPGHGGVLDRFDGVMFAAPAIYLYMGLGSVG